MMRIRPTRFVVAGGLLTLIGVLAIPTMVEAQADTLPDSITQAMVAEGATLFQGAGICAACHGPDGTGLTGPDLTDDEWLHSDGSYESIVERILAGVPADSSKSGIPMLPKGGSQLTDAQVRLVAAYVWSLRLEEAP